MYSFRKSRICCIWGFLLLTSAVYAQQPERVTIERIDVRGNRRIPEDTIRFYIQSRPGQIFDPGRLELDLRALYKANFFENIEIDEEDGDTGKIITFYLKEKPLIRSLNYDGNKSFTESDILDNFKERKVGLTVDSQYDPAKIRAAERALKDLQTLNGKPLGSVRSEIEQIPPSSVRVRFIMDEGPKVRIGKIRFIGEKIYDDDDLKAAMQLTKERGLFSMFKGTDKFHEGKIEADIEMNLKSFYQERGHMQVQVGKPRSQIFEGPRGFLYGFRKTKQQYLVEIPIDAGDQYRVGKIELKNCGIFNCEALVQAFGHREGDIVNFKRIKESLEEIKKLYADVGYIDMNYIPETKFDEKEKTMDLVFKFQPAKQFFVHRINFRGNTKTRDKVLRREFVLEEGRVFSGRLLDQSILRVNQLGFFERIEEQDYEVRPDERNGEVDIDVNVKERSQQSIGFTGGVSGISGSFIGVNYTTNNFLGRGERLEFSVTGGTRTTDFIVSFTEPYLLDTRWTMGASLFNQRFRFDTFSAFGFGFGVSGKPIELFTRRTTGVTFSVSRPLGLSLWRLGISYSYQNISVGNIASGFESFALGQLIGFVPGGNIQESAASGIKRSEITPSISYNSTNHFFFPTRGSSMTFSMAVTGGILGGDFSMIRPVVEYRHFLPDKWLSKGRHTIGFRFLGQYVQSFGNSSVPFFDRIFIGGETTIRGFDIRSISPLALTTTPRKDIDGNPIVDLVTGLPSISRNVTPVGGDTLGIYNLEYRIPIAGPLSMAAFYDIGVARVVNPRGIGSFGDSTTELIKLTNSAIRSSTGVEIQFLLPVVSAPFRLIFAWNPHALDQTIFVGNLPILIREPRRDIKFTIGRSF